MLYKRAGLWMSVVGLVIIVGAIVCCKVRGKSIEEKNKNIVRQTHDEVWSKGNIALIDKLYDPHCVVHWATGIDNQGLEALKKTIIESRTNMPDLTETIELIVAEGDLVVTYWLSSGTFNGVIEGISYRDKKMSLKEMAIYRLVEGKIVEQWIVANNLLVMQQLGMELKPATL